MTRLPRDTQEAISSATAILAKSVASASIDCLTRIDSSMPLRR